MENYAIYILQNALRDEIISNTDAVNYGLGTHAYDDIAGSEPTERAFRESKIIAEKRIPELVNALEKLNDSTQKAALNDCLCLLEEVDKDFNCLSTISKQKIQHYKTLLNI